MTGWLSFLRKSYPTVATISPPIDPAWMQEPSPKSDPDTTGTKFLMDTLQKYADEREDKTTPLKVGFVGYPNVGKTSLINR